MTQPLRPVLRIVGLLLLVLAGLLAGTARADMITYFHNDPSGSPVAATDESGRLLWKESYRPYGERLLNGASPNANRLWFTGKPQDPDTGLSYLGARYYSPQLGRFMGIDPKAVDPGDPHSFNRYAYANNNPYKFVDPDGSHPILVALTYFALRYAVVYAEELLVATIVAAEVAGGAPTPLSAGASAAAAEVRAIKGAEETVAAKASATIMQHPGNPTHFSVAVEGGEHTHQVVTGAASTRIVTTEVAEAGPVLRQATVDVDAAAAARQAELLGIQNLGAYDKVMNSCVSHVCDVLGAGGVAVPDAEGSAQLRFLLEMVKQGDGGGN